MINEITPEQEAKIPEYRAKWLKKILDNSRLDYDQTLDIAQEFVVEILERKKMPVVIVDNPVEAWVMCHFAMDGVPVKELPKKVDEYFEGKIKMDLEDYVNPYQDGSFSALVFAYYDFMFNELGIEIEADLMRKYKIWEKTVDIGLMFPLEEVCIVTQKPTVLKLNEERRLHCDGGPAMEYAGRGVEPIYCLNGVNVDEYLAVTPSHELSMDYYNKLQNADVKAEFIRKIGIERMLEMGKKIDSYENYNDEWWTKSEYELWDMAAIFKEMGIDYAPHLKMRNQTTKVWHVEAVSPSVRNIQDAIKERFGGDFKIRAIA